MRSLFRLTVCPLNVYPILSFNIAISDTPGPGTYQTDIWSLNPITLELTATWTNTDGTRVPVTIFFDNDATEGNVGLTGDLPALVAAAKAKYGNVQCSTFGGALTVSPCAIPIRLYYAIYPESHFTCDSGDVFRE